MRIVRAAQVPYVIRMATNAILSQEARTMKRITNNNRRITALIHARRWQAIADRDRSLDGTFVSESRAPASSAVQAVPRSARAART